MKINKKKFKVTRNIVKLVNNNPIENNNPVENNNPIEINIQKERKTYKHSEEYYDKKVKADYEKYKASTKMPLPEIIYNSMWKKQLEKGVKVTDIGKNILFQDTHGMSKTAYDARRRIIEKQIKEGSYTSKKDPHSKAQAALNMSNESLRQFVSDYYNILKSQNLDKKAIRDAIHDALYQD